MFLQLFIIFCSQWWNLELPYDFKWLKLRLISEGKFNSTSIFIILIHSLLKLVIFNILNLLFLQLFIIFCSQWWNLELPYDFKWLKLRLISEGKFNSTSIFNILIHSLLKLVIFNILLSNISFICILFFVLNDETWNYRMISSD